MTLMSPNTPSSKWPLRICLCIIVVLAVSAGYYQDVGLSLQRKYGLLEDKYVRIRSVLGREKTQELIDQSLPLKPKE